MSRGLIALIVAIAAVGAVGVIPSLVDRQSSNEASALAPSPGAAPAGKVWSAEHGHWHDAPRPGMPAAGTNPIQITPQQVGGGTPQPVTLTPQPAGEVPPGKVWSPEHGHWHDAPAQ